MAQCRGLGLEPGLGPEDVVVAGLQALLVPDDQDRAGRELDHLVGDAASSSPPRLVRPWEPTTTMPAPSSRACWRMAPAGEPPVLGRTVPSALTPAASSSATISSTIRWASSGRSPATVGGSG